RLPVGFIPLVCRGDGPGSAKVELIRLGVCHEVISPGHLTAIVLLFGGDHMGWATLRSSVVMVVMLLGRSTLTEGLGRGALRRLRRKTGILTPVLPATGTRLIQVPPIILMELLLGTRRRLALRRRIGKIARKGRELHLGDEVLLVRVIEAVVGLL